jgi:predicted nucleic acid-binding protein
MPLSSWTTSINSVTEESQQDSTPPERTGAQPAESSLEKEAASGEVEDTILQLLKIATITPGAEIALGASQVPADDMVLSCAVEGQADFAISGDQDLIKLESYEGIKIVTPANFLQPKEYESERRGHPCPVPVPRC